MDDLTDDELLAFRDMMDAWAAEAQMALGFYGSGGEVAPDRVARARAGAASRLAKYPDMRKELARWVERIQDERARSAAQSARIKAARKDRKARR